jgi:hypothetical protein
MARPLSRVESESRPYKGVPCAAGGQGASALDATLCPLPLPLPVCLVCARAIKRVHARVHSRVRARVWVVPPHSQVVKEHLTGPGGWYVSAFGAAEFGPSPSSDGHVTANEAAAAGLLGHTQTWNLGY